MDGDSYRISCDVFYPSTSNTISKRRGYFEDGWRKPVFCATLSVLFLSEKREALRWVDPMEGAQSYEEFPKLRAIER